MRTTAQNRGGVGQGEGVIYCPDREYGGRDGGAFACDGNAAVRPIARTDEAIRERSTRCVFVNLRGSQCEVEILMLFHTCASW